MNIVFFSARYPPDLLGGGEVSTATIAEGLAGRGHQVTVLTGAANDAHEERGGVTVVRSSALHALWAKPLFERRLSASLRAALRQLLPHDADVLHAHDFRSALLLSLVDHPQRAVTIRDFAPICGTTNNMWWDGRSCDGCFWPNVLFRCHRVVEASLARKPFRVWQYKFNLGFRGEAFTAIPHHVYTSQALKDRIATRFAVPASSRVIPNPVGPTWLRAPSDARAIPPRVLFVGRVETTKGIATLLEAVRELLEDVPDIEVEIIGGGELDRYRRRADSLGIARLVQFTGTVPYEELPTRIDTARVVVQPSLWEEPFGRTVIEAGARARPVVASNVGGLRELVTPETGTLVPPGHASALARGLRQFLLDSAYARACGMAGRARVEQYFTADRVAAAYEGFYSAGPRA